MMAVSKTEEQAMENMINSMNRQRQLEWALEMSRVVTTRDIQGIVADHRTPVSPGIPNTAPAYPSQNGWVDAKPISPPPGIDLIDGLCDAADRRDRAAAKAVAAAVKKEAGDGQG
jgi:hypothetical protein